MIKVKYERYWTDFVRKDEEKTFTDLGTLADWIFGQMQQDYADSSVMFFPTPDKSRLLRDNGPGHIRFKPTYGGEDILIHLIRNADGIIFSDGQFTSGQKHWSTSAKEWLVACDKRQHDPKFDFVDEQPTMTAKEDGRSTLLVHLDYGDGEHGYVLYRIPADRLEEAGTVAGDAWAAYDGSGRQGSAEEAFEAAFRRAGIPFSCETYEVRRIVT